MDFPPLLSPGLHLVTLTDLYKLTVEDRRFRLSRTREQIMKSLWTLAACLCRWGVGEELWVDGSLLTEKIDPKDADLVLVLPENFQSSASAEQIAIWDWWDDSANEPKLLFRCDTFSLPRVAMGDPDYRHYLMQDLYWKQFFGTSRDGLPKGIGRILLPSGCI